MTTISAQIPNELYLSLCSTAKQLDRSSSSIVRQALAAYLQELREDMEDYNDALEALKDDSPTYTLEEIEKKYGLGD